MIPVVCSVSVRNLNIIACQPPALQCAMVFGTHFPCSSHTSLVPHTGFTWFDFLLHCYGLRRSPRKCLVALHAVSLFNCPFGVFGRSSSNNFVFGIVFGTRLSYIFEIPCLALSLSLIPKRIVIRSSGKITIVFIGNEQT